MGRVDADPKLSELLTTAQAAAWARVRAASWRRMLSRGDAPEPAKRIGNKPLWTLAVLEEWSRQRPSRGWRRRK